MLDLVDVGHGGLPTPPHHPERLADALGPRKKIRWRPMVEAMLTDVAFGAQSPLELRHLAGSNAPTACPPAPASA